MKKLSAHETRDIKGGSDICYNGYILSTCGGQVYTTCQVCGTRYYGFGCISSIIWHCIWTGHMR